LPSGYYQTRKKVYLEAKKGLTWPFVFDKIYLSARKLYGTILACPGIGPEKKFTWKQKKA
jgi:hypothetical protein